MNDIKNYIEQNRKIFLEELFDWIRIPSISSLAAHKPDMVKAAEYLKTQLEKAGVDFAEVSPSDGNPVVFAEKIIDKSFPTILIYGHYDVMPVDPLEEWKTKPFEPAIIDNRIYARGANDDKGQSFIQIKAFEYLMKTGQLRSNVKFLVEGEEEIGSPSLAKWCTTHKEKLSADIILVSDTGMIGKDIPSVTVGLRGLTYVQIEVTGPNRDLHSGLFGGAVANPVNVLCQMIASLTDENNRITIPGFYDDVLELTSEEKEELARAPFNIEEYKKAINVDELAGEKGFSTMERLGSRPSIDVNGIWGGYQGEGAKTILPSKVYAKISMRLVPHQNHIKIGELFEKHFKEIAPPTVKIDIKILHGGQGYVCPTNIPEYKAAEQAYTDVFVVKPVPVRSGGSIPIIVALEEVLGLKSILMGFGLDSDAIHGPNENFQLECFEKGIMSIVRFYEHYANMKHP